MDNSFTVNAAQITAFAAIVAPTITALIHSIKEYRIAKMSHTIESRLKYCEAFSESYVKCQYGPEKTGYMSDFYKRTMQLILVCHRSRTRRSLFQLANKVNSHGASHSTDALYEKCLRLLAREL